MSIIYLALGVNAHVNNDLGLALYDTVHTEDFKTDFDKVDAVIIDSLDELIHATKLPIFYKSFIHILIKRWREKAWKNFTDMQRGIKTIRNIEDKAEKFACDLAKVNSIADFYQLYRIF